MPACRLRRRTDRQHIGVAHGCRSPTARCAVVLNHPTATTFRLPGRLRRRERHRHRRLRRLRHGDVDLHEGDRRRRAARRGRAWPCSSSRSGCPPHPSPAPGSCSWSTAVKSGVAESRWSPTVPDLCKVRAARPRAALDQVVRHRPRCRSSAVQLRLIWLLDAAVAVRLPGAVGACVSGAAGVVAVAMFE